MGVVSIVLANCSLSSVAIVSCGFTVGTVKVIVGFLLFCSITQPLSGDDFSLLVTTTQNNPFALLSLPLTH
jgi:hypothetical protein